MCEPLKEVYQNNQIKSFGSLKNEQQILLLFVNHENEVGLFNFKFKDKNYDFKKDLSFCLS